MRGGYGRRLPTRSATQPARAERPSGADVGASHDAGASVPSLARLRGLARHVLGRRPDGPDEIDELVAIGWLAYAEHAARHPGSVPQRYYARARGAMLDALTRDHGLTGRADGARLVGLDDRLPAAAEAPAERDTLVRRLGLRASDIRAWQAYCARRLTERDRRLMLALTVEGRSLAEAGAALGWTPRQAAVRRSRAIARLRPLPPTWASPSRFR